MERESCSYPLLVVLRESVRPTRSPVAWLTKFSLANYPLRSAHYPVGLDFVRSPPAIAPYGEVESPHTSVVLRNPESLPLPIPGPPGPNRALALGPNRPVSPAVVPLWRGCLRQKIRLSRARQFLLRPSPAASESRPRWHSAKPVAPDR